uniref:Uncharacterized protein n=1 Tax=Triticum urartu TaxID=4572 RepID=A0A8R7UVH5_TRIUA
MLKSLCGISDFNFCFSLLKWRGPCNSEIKVTKSVLLKILAMTRGEMKYLSEHISVKLEFLPHKQRH